MAKKNFRVKKVGGFLHWCFHCLLCSTSHRGSLVPSENRPVHPQVDNPRWIFPNQLPSRRPSRANRVRTQVRSENKLEMQWFTPLFRMSRCLRSARWSGRTISLSTPVTIQRSQSLPTAFVSEYLCATTSPMPSQRQGRWKKSLQQSSSFPTFSIATSATMRMISSRCLHSRRGTIPLATTLIETFSWNSLVEYLRSPP